MSSDENPVLDSGLGVLDVLAVGGAGHSAGFSIFINCFLIYCGVPRGLFYLSYGGCFFADEEAFRLKFSSLDLASDKLL